MSPPDYPKKQMGAGALFFNGAGELLVVKPTYRDHWSVPGGVIEDVESPRQGCTREVLEEVELGPLLVVDYTSLATNPRESLQFLFHGGPLDDKSISRLVLPPAELSAYRFVTIDEAIASLNPRLARRLPHALHAIQTGQTAYLEDGQPPHRGGDVALAAVRA